MEKSDAGYSSKIPLHADRNLPPPIHDRWQIVEQMATFDDVYYMIRRTVRCPLDVTPSGKDVRFEEKWVSLGVMGKSALGRGLLNDWHGEELVISAN